MAKEDQVKAEKLVQRILSSLDEKERSTILPLVVKQLEQHLEMYSNRGEVVSAVALDEEYIKRVESLLEKKLNEKIVLENKVDKKILGGIIIRFRDLVIDLSLKRQLEDLKDIAYGA